MPSATARVAARIAEIRAQRGLTQESLAARARINLQRGRDEEEGEGGAPAPGMLTQLEDQPPGQRPAVGGEAIVVPGGHRVGQNLRVADPDAERQRDGEDARVPEGEAPGLAHEK